MDDSDHPVYDRLEQEILDGAGRIIGWFERPEPSHSSQPEPAPAATMTPALQPVNLAAALPQTQEETMSLATIEEEIGNRIATVEAAVHAEIGKLVADLPGITAEAKQLAGNPFAQVAIKAAEHLAAGALPVNAIATVAGNALKWLDDLAALYSPQQTSQAPAEAPAQ